MSIFDFDFGEKLKLSAKLCSLDFRLVSRRRAVDKDESRILRFRRIPMVIDGRCVSYWTNRYINSTAAKAEMKNQTHQRSRLGKNRCTSNASSGWAVEQSRKQIRDNGNRFRLFPTQYSLNFGWVKSVRANASSHTFQLLHTRALAMFGNICIKCWSMRCPLRAHTHTVVIYAWVWA